MLADAPYHQIADAAVGQPIDTLLDLRRPPASAAASDDARLIGWIREQAPGVRRLGAVCTGAFVLAHTGLLDEARVTTHWRHAGRLATRYPGRPSMRTRSGFAQAATTPRPASRRAWTCRWRWWRKTWDTRCRSKCAGTRPFPTSTGQLGAFSSLRAQAAESVELRALQGWMADHLDRDLSVAVLAERGGDEPAQLRARLRASRWGRPRRAAWSGCGWRRCGGCWRPATAGWRYRPRHRLRQRGHHAAGLPAALCRPRAGTLPGGLPGMERGTAA